MKEKMSTTKLMFWNKNNNEKTNEAKTEAKNTKNGRNWLHAPDVLINGHVAYLVKFLGSTQVEQPKGIEVVKEAIRRLQFTQQIKKAEGGAGVKMKKVEITVSVDGVAVQEPRTTNILHQFPLHKISYCADEKGVKKYFSFIAKTGGSNPSTLTNGDSNSINTSSSSSTTGTSDESHECFVFISNKLASDITLTIGQAFDLAYRRYMSDSGKQFELAKLQSHNKHLENTVQVYRNRLREMSEILSKSDLDRLLIRLGLREICEVPPEANPANGINGNKTPDLGIDVSAPNNDDQMLIETSSKHFAPIVPPRNLQSQMSNTFDALKPSVGTKLEGLLLNSDSDSDFDPRAEEPEPVMNGSTNNGNKIINDLFGFEPKSFGQQLFTSTSHTNGNSTSHINGPPNSPPPLLAPPPKAATPRRNGTNVSSLMNGSQDPFGSIPFDASSQSNAFDVSVDTYNASSGFHEDFSFDSHGVSNEFDASFNSTNVSVNQSQVFAEISSLSKNFNQLDNILHHDAFTAEPDTSKMAKSPIKGNPFSFMKPNGSSASMTDLNKKESPKKNHFLQKSTEMIKHKSNRYEFFENSNDLQVFPGEQTAPTASKTEVDPELFKDFAIAAFKDLKVDPKNKLPKFGPTKQTSQNLIKSSACMGQSASIANNSNLFGDFDDRQNKFNGMSFNADDFTLESLDPLRK